MKRMVFSVLSVLAMAMVFAVPNAQAQSALVVKVPFDFTLGQHSMAAGEYQVQSISEQAAMIRNVETGAAEIFIKAVKVNAAKSAGARLIFAKYGDQYFVRQIWDGNSDIGIQLSQSHRERALRIAQSEISDGPEIVTIAMK